eukprot:COSAG01_NODE_5939_length_3941_cov_35.353462_1_plen_211_part_00
MGAAPARARAPGAVAIMAGQRRLLVVAAVAMAASPPLLPRSSARLVRPRTPPRGMNSFDIQYDRRRNSSIPVWNEAEFRTLATAMATQLLPAGYDTIVIDGGWAGSTIDAHGRPAPDLWRWPSSRGGLGFKPLADWTHSLGLKFGVRRCVCWSHDTTAVIIPPLAGMDAAGCAAGGHHGGTAGARRQPACDAGRGGGSMCGRGSTGGAIV